MSSVWGMILQWKWALGSLSQPDIIYMYDWKTVESDVKPERTSKILWSVAGYPDIFVIWASILYHFWFGLRCFVSLVRLKACTTLNVFTRFCVISALLWVSLLAVHLRFESVIYDLTSWLLANFGMLISHQRTYWTDLWKVLKLDFQSCFKHVSVK